MSATGVYTAPPSCSHIFLTTNSLSSCSQLFVIVCQHASFSYRSHNAHALAQVRECFITGVFGKTLIFTHVPCTFLVAHIPLLRPTLSNSTLILTTNGDTSAIRSDVIIPGKRNSAGTFVVWLYGRLEPPHSSRSEAY